MRFLRGVSTRPDDDGPQAKKKSTATITSKTAPGDTAQAAWYIAQNPATNTAALFALVAPSPPFPALTSPPRSFAVSAPTDLVACFAVLGGSAVSNTATSATVVSGGALSFGLAIDTSNNIWLANEQNIGGVNSDLGSITKLDSGGAPLSGVSGFGAGGIYFPVAVTADPNGNMWIVNYGDSKVTLLNSSGASLSGAAGWGGMSLEFPVTLAVDSNHNAWVANQSANSITRLSADGLTNTVVTCCDGAPGMATDQSNNVWVANYYGDSISEVSSSGVVLLNGIIGGGILHPQRHCRGWLRYSVGSQLSRQLYLQGQQQRFQLFSRIISLACERLWGRRPVDATLWARARRQWQCLGLELRQRYHHAIFRCRLPPSKHPSPAHLPFPSPCAPLRGGPTPPEGRLMLSGRS